MDGHVCTWELLDGECGPGALIELEWYHGLGVWSSQRYHILHVEGGLQYKTIKFDVNGRYYDQIRVLIVVPLSLPG